MASYDNNLPHFPPPPPPSGRPPLPPSPHILPPPPPPPHITPPPLPPSPDNGPTVIVIIFISFGCLLFLAFLALALCCWIKKMKKKKKMVQEADVIRVDEHLKVKKGVVHGPHGEEAVVLEVEDDVHIVEEIKKNEQFLEGKHVKSTDNISSALEEGTSTSSQHNYLEHNPK